MNDNSAFHSAVPAGTIRRITPGDLPAIVEMLEEFAAFEEYNQPVKSCEESLYLALFGARPLLFGFIAYRSGEPAGFVLACDGYSTYAARPRLFIEDLYVRADRRGGGVGGALISAIARHCVEHGYAGMRWSVRTTNTPALRFYTSIGAAFPGDRRDCALDGEALQALANRS
jgi:GNAT superfamily N-acetyltransferase